MITKELREILNSVADLEDGHRILIAVDGREWEIDGVRLEYTGDEDCTVIEAKTGDHKDLHLRSSTTRCIQRGERLAPVVDQGSQSKKDAQDRIPCKTALHELKTSPHSQGVLSRILQWFGIGGLSYAGDSSILPNDEWWHRRNQAPIQLETLSPVATHGLLGF
jgi:hypothetical protein